MVPCLASVPLLLLPPASPEVLANTMEHEHVHACFVAAIRPSQLSLLLLLLPLPLLLLAGSRSPGQHRGVWRLTRNCRIRCAGADAATATTTAVAAWTLALVRSGLTTFRPAPVKLHYVLHYVITQSLFKVCVHGT